MRQSLIVAAAIVVWLGGVQASTAQSLLDRLERTLTQPQDDLPLPEPPPPTTSTGRPTLGVTAEPVTDDVARRRGLAVRRGALITAVVQGSPADQAGLPLGGVIVAVNGERIDSSRELVAAIRAARTDRPIEISYYEGERLFRKKVQLVAGAAGNERTVPREPARIPEAPLRESITERRFPRRDRSRDGLGDRPLLGRVGQIIDGLVAPAGGEFPLEGLVPQPGEAAALREQVATLQQQVEQLQARLAEIEKQLAAQNNNEPAEAGDDPF